MRGSLSVVALCFLTLPSKAYRWHGTARLRLYRRQSRHEHREAADHGQQEALQEVEDQDRLQEADFELCRQDAQAKRHILYAGAEQQSGKRY